MSQIDVTDQREIVKIRRPEPSWIPIHYAPFHYQAMFPRSRRGMSFFLGPYRLSEELIDAVVLNNVHGPSIAACKINRDYHQFVLQGFESSDGSPKHRDWDPFDIRQQLKSRDGTAHLVEQIEAVWTTMEIRFRRAHCHGHCKLLARAGSPHALRFTEVPPDVFALYKVTDWRKGVARTVAGDHLYALHVATPTKDQIVPTLNDIEDALILEPNTEIPLVAVERAEKQQKNKLITTKSVEEAYKARVSEYVKNNKPPPERGEDEKWVKDILGVGRVSARKLRELFAPESWHKIGRRPKRKQIGEIGLPAQLPK